MAISLTNSAAERVRSYLDRRGHGVGLRVGVRKTGCSGYAYVIDYADSIGDDDAVFEDGGVKVIVVKDGLNEAFKFRNPNVKGECGCGESFNV